MDVRGGGRQWPGQSRRERELAFFRPQDPAVRPARSRRASRAQCACPAAAAAAAAEGGRFPGRPLPAGGTSVGARLAKGRALRTGLRSTSPAGGMLAGAALLLALGLTLGVPPDSSAASRSPAPSRDGRLPRALEPRDAPPEFYHRDGRVCKKCPPGTYISVHCTTLRTEGTCLPCPDDQFIQHQNQYETCFNCKSCRLLDEVELQPCTKTSDTRCACKNGTFCPPSLPCETCSKCTARCPDGEVMVRPCTPASDMQCEKSPTVAPPTASAPAAAAGPGLWIWITLGVLLALLVLGAFVCKKKGRGGGPESRTTTCSSRTIQRLKRKFHLQRSDDQDNRRNERVAQESQHVLLIPADASPAVPWPQKGTEESSVTEGHLVPQNGRDPLEALRQSFETFIKWVPLNAWKRFMRALGLTDNEIATAELDEKGVTEQQFQMLRTWLDKRGKEAALDTLLDTLRAIGLQGVGSTVRQELLSEGLYCLQANPSCTDS